MKVKKGTLTVVAYGKTEDEMIDNLLFDLHEIIRKEGDDTLTCIEDVDTEEEGIDGFDNYMWLDEVIERNLQVDLETGQVLDEHRNVYCDEDGEVCFISPQELKELQESDEYKKYGYHEE